MKAVIGLSSASPKSMSTCFESDPQMPVSRLRSTSQSSAMSGGSSRSTSAIGTVLRLRSSNGASSGSGVGPRFGIGQELQRLHGSPSFWVVNSTTDD